MLTTSVAITTALWNIWKKSIFSSAHLSKKKMDTKSSSSSRYYVHYVCKLSSWTGKLPFLLFIALFLHFFLHLIFSSHAVTFTYNVEWNASLCTHRCMWKAFMYSRLLFVEKNNFQAFSSFLLPIPRPRPFKSLLFSFNRYCKVKWKELLLVH